MRESRRCRNAAGLFLLQAVAYVFGDPAWASRLSGTLEKSAPVDVQGLEENAACHEMEPLLHAVVEDCEKLGYPLDLPEGLKSTWARAYERGLARTALICHGAAMAINALAQAGVRAVPLKGYYLASRFYSRKGARSFRDLDLLVERESLPNLNRALLDAGFIPQPGRPSFVPAPAHTVYALPIDRSDLAMEIDIHIGMHWPEEYFRRTAFDPRDLWSEVSPQEVEGLPSWGLSPEHLMITTLLDVAVNHRYARLIKFRDLREVLGRVEPDWDKVVSCCRRWKVCSFVGPGLLFLEEMCREFAVSPRAREDVLPSYPLMKAFLRSLPLASLPGHRSRSFSPSNLLFFMLADTLRGRIRGLAGLPSHAYRGLRPV